MRAHDGALGGTRSLLPLRVHMPRRKRPSEIPRSELWLRRAVNDRPAFVDEVTEHDK